MRMEEISEERQFHFGYVESEVQDDISSRQLDL